jgi:hypothetical protein
MEYIAVFAYIYGKSSFCTGFAVRIVPGNIRKHAEEKFFLPEKMMKTPRKASEDVQAFLKIHLKLLFRTLKEAVWYDTDNNFCLKGSCFMLLSAK